MKQEEIVYGPLELPSGMKIKFREARGIDRANVLMVHKDLAKENNLGNQILLDAYISIKCITEIDGQPPTQNYKGLYDDMSEADLDFYESVRREMFSITEEKRQKVKEAAAFLLGKPTSTDTSSSQNTAKR